MLKLLETIPKILELYLYFHCDLWIQSTASDMQRRSILPIQLQMRRVEMKTLVMRKVIQATMILPDMQTRRVN